VLVGTFLQCREPAAVSMQKDLSTFPFVIEGYRGYDTASLFTRLEDQGGKHFLSRIYKAPTGESMYLYVAYYEKQGQGKELVSYRTKPLHHNASTYELDGRMRLKVNRRVLPRLRISEKTVTRGFLNKFFGQTYHRRADAPGADSGTVMFFWYDINGRILADPYSAKLYGTFDALAKQRTNGAMVMVILESRGKDVETLNHESEQLIRTTILRLRDFLPSSS
jgi:EpsI family protein